MGSWRLVLGELKAAARAGGEDDLIADITQLQALCASQDGEAFLPLRIDELTDQQMARRIVQYYALPADITTRAANEGVVKTVGLRAARSAARYGSYCLLGPWGVYLVIDPELWARYGQGPLWLLFQARADKGTWNAKEVDWPQLASRLVGLSHGQPAGPTVVSIDGHPALGLRLRTLSERDDVISDVVEQLRAIRTAIGDEPSPQEVPPNPPDLGVSDEGAYPLPGSAP